MGLKHFIRELPNRGLKTSWYYFREWAVRNNPLGSTKWGESVYSREWDVLVILDACRVDLMKYVADEYAWLPQSGNIQSVDSIAGSSKEWMQRTFIDSPDPAVSDTAYISGNPFTDAVFADGHPFALLDEVWRDGWDDATGTVRPEVMVDHAITHGREHDGPLIVHMMQPHIPFIGSPTFHPGFDPTDWGSPDAVRNGNAQEQNVWQRLRTGDLDESAVWPAYADNLSLALDEVARLIENINGRVILTADHGNAMGESGVFGHPDVPVSTIRRVPWVEIEATDKRTSTPDIQLNDTDATVTERLASLGYVEGK